MEESSAGVGRKRFVAGLLAPGALLPCAWPEVPPRLCPAGTSFTLQP
jgi:hypothetical protein